MQAVEPTIQFWMPTPATWPNGVPAYLAHQQRNMEKLAAQAGKIKRLILEYLSTYHVTDINVLPALPLWDDDDPDHDYEMFLGTDKDLYFNIPEGGVDPIRDAIWAETELRGRFCGRYLRLEEHIRNAHLIAATARPGACSMGSQFQTNRTTTVGTQSAAEIAERMDHMAGLYRDELPHVREWVRRVAMMGSNQLRQSEVGSYRISTVLLGWNHGLAQGIDAWFETIVFKDGDDVWLSQSSTWEEALDSHDAARKYVAALPKESTMFLDEAANLAECRDYRQLWRSDERRGRRCTTKLPGRCAARGASATGRARGRSARS